MPTVRVLLCAVLLTLAAAAPAAAAPTVHAHRGGPLAGGVTVFAENTMPAFRNAWERYGAVLEMDVKLTRDRVPVVIHDATLDRVTVCDGRVDARTFGELAACPVDVAGGAEAIPSLAEFLAWARDAGAWVNLEIKNHPQEPDFDITNAYADTVVDAIAASGFPAGRLIVQSFWPGNLDVAKRRLPGAQMSLLTLGG
jgi:glycerophosphoryl diester phosphodiesterase